MTGYAVTDPFTGQRLRESPTATDAEVQAALARTHAAYRSWGRTTTPADRAAPLGSTMEVYSQELFAPVSVVHRVRSDEEAVRPANDTPYGLSASVHSRDVQRALRVAGQLEVGMVYINGTDASAPEPPFGGVKRSGFGRELGRYGIEEFVNRKLVHVRS